MANNIKKGVKVGLGVAALTAGVAAAYLLGPQGAKHRKQAKGWANKLKSEVAGKVKKMESLSKAAYHQAVKEVTDKYKQAKSIDPKEIEAVASDLKRAWDKIAKLGSARAKTTVKAKSKTAKSRSR